MKTKLTSLDKFRQASAEREKKHAEIEKQMQARHAAGKEDLKGAIDRLEKHVNKEDVEQVDEISQDLAGKYLKKVTHNQLKKQGMHPNLYSQLSPKRQTGVSRALDRLIVNKEDVGMVGGSPTNSVGSGDVAGLGVGPQGEPGVKLRDKKKVVPFAIFTRKPTLKK
jgi:hypothetical protein